MPLGWLWTFGSVPEVEPKALLAVSQEIEQAASREDPTVPRIIDVRTRAEYDAGHIAHALHASFLPPWSFPTDVAPLLAGLHVDTPLYVVCLSAHRSIGALKWLRGQSYSSVKQLKGGMQAWRREALPEVRSEAPPQAQAHGQSGSSGASSVAVGQRKVADEGA